jgi:outer membrane protein W
MLSKKGIAVRSIKSAGTLVAILLIIALLPPTAMSEGAPKSPLQSLRSKNQLGVRLGAWASQGEAPPASGSNSSTGESFHTNINNTNFYFEFYGSLRATDVLRGELSVGTVNRGSVTVQQGPFADVGNLNVFPILIKARIYPLIMTSSRLQPHVAAGGGIYYARRNVQFTNNAFYYTGLNEDSEVDFNYVLSAGIDYVASSIIAVEAQAAYMPISFSNPLVGVKDYKAVGITIGVKYLR